MGAAVASGWELQKRRTNHSRVQGIGLVGAVLPPPNSGNPSSVNNPAACATGVLSAPVVSVAWATVSLGSAADRTAVAAEPNGPGHAASGATSGGPGMVGCSILEDEGGGASGPPRPTPEEGRDPASTSGRSVAPRRTSAPALALMLPGWKPVPISTEPTGDSLPAGGAVLVGAGAVTVAAGTPVPLGSGADAGSVPVSTASAPTAELFSPPPVDPVPVSASPADSDVTSAPPSPSPSSSVSSLVVLSLVVAPELLSPSPGSANAVPASPA